MNVVLCPGDFYIYKPESHPHGSMGYVTCKEWLLMDMLYFILTCPICCKLRYSYFTKIVLCVFASICVCVCVCYPCLDHSTCSPNSCGPLAECVSGGGCACVSGYEIPSNHQPTGHSYGCVGKCSLFYLNCFLAWTCTVLPISNSCLYRPLADIDECMSTAGICGSNSNCTNTIGAYRCTCLKGFNATNPAIPPGNSNKCIGAILSHCPFQINASFLSCVRQVETSWCFFLFFIDINECLDNPCGDHGSCNNKQGSFECECHEGYQVVPDARPMCQGQLFSCPSCSLIGVVCTLLFAYYAIQRSTG